MFQFVVKEIKYLVEIVWIVEFVFLLQLNVYLKLFLIEYIRHSFFLTSL
jgi:hypothetical protein